MSSQAQSQRFTELDSLRGLAALTVAVHHYLLTVTSDVATSQYFLAGRVIKGLTLSPLYVVSAGHEAVIFFFVLSGFVLSLPFHAHRPSPYVPFVIRRICRIWLPYACSVVLAVGADRLLYSGAKQDLSPWFNYPWSPPITVRSIAEHLLLVGVYDQGQFDPVYGSLTQEMRISLVFPVLAVFSSRARWTWVVGAGACGTVASSLVARQVHTPAIIDLLNTVHFVSMFLLGSLLARYRKEIVAAYGQLSGRGRVAVGATLVVVYAYGRAGSHFGLTNLGDWPIALAACGFMVMALAGGRVQRFLLWRPVRLLGEMSYSLYLLHAIVLLCFVHGLYATVPMAILLPSALVVSLGLARLMYVCVEMPSIRLGRWLTVVRAPEGSPPAGASAP